MSLCRLLSAMDRATFETQVVCMIPIGPVGQMIQNLGIPVVSLEMPRGRPTLAGFRRLLGILRGFKPDILQTWLYHADLLGLVAARIVGPKTVIWNIRSSCTVVPEPGSLLAGLRTVIARVHSTETAFPRERPLSTLVVRGCSLLSTLPTAVIVNSRTGQELHMRLGYRPKEWINIPNGTDTTQFRPDPQARQKVRREWRIAEDELLVGLVGRLHPEKDHPTFLKAAALSRSRYPRVRYVCVGGGPEAYDRQLRGLAAQLGLADLLWTGQRADMLDVYNALDVLVSSSVSEGSPNVVAEAMACEKPCLVTRVGDSASLVGTADMVVQPGDPEALSTKLLHLLELPEEQRAQRGRDARQRIAENFTLEAMVKRYASLYLRIDSQHR
jgi:glycosyltransferase involved in cell wall biosynthesis